MEFPVDRLIERLHRLLVILEDDCKSQRLELPPLAVYDVRGRRWLLVAGIALDRLRECTPPHDESAEYLIFAGAGTTRVDSDDWSDLMTRFTSSARSAARASVPQ